jgi:hypothetical protein
MPIRLVAKVGESVAGSQYGQLTAPFDDGTQIPSVPFGAGIGTG